MCVHVCVYVCVCVCAAVYNETLVKTTCSEDFYLDNDTGLCRPECGKWIQYPRARKRAVYGVDSSFTALAVLIDSVTLVVSCIRYKMM